MQEFESRRAFEHLDKLAYEIGPRLAGTRGDRMASDYIRKQFESEVSHSCVTLTTSATRNLCGVRLVVTPDYFS